MTSRPGRIKECINVNMARPRVETDKKFIDYKIVITDLLKGEIVNGRKPYERNVSTVFQSYALFPHLSVRENIEFGPRRHRMTAARSPPLERRPVATDDRPRDAPIAPPGDFVK